MALVEMNFTFNSGGKNTISNDWAHAGVVGSGDMEILLTKAKLEGKVNVKIVTPVRGFNHIWEKVVEKFVVENQLADVQIEINDNNATPFIASMRLRQGLLEAKEAL